MASKVTCTCGWSWNKSDSSKKDATVCHICGKNNMKNGGWLDKYDDGGNASLRSLMNNDGLKSKSDATKVVPQKTMTKEQADKFKARKDAEELQRRKTAIETSNAARNKSFSVQNLADESGAIGDKFRMFPNDPNSFIDEYINPGVMVGNMASGLGRVPLNIQEGNYGQAAMSVAAPIATGALAGIGAQNTGQFANNLVNPLAGTSSLFSKAIGKGAKNITKVTKAAISNALALLDQAIPRLDPIKAMGVQMDIMDLSPLNLIPGYGKKLSGKNQTFRKFGNSLDDVIQRQTLSPAGGSNFRMGKNQIVREGNWAARNQPSENYPGVFEATFDMNNPNANLSAIQIPDRNGVLMVDRLGRSLPEIPLTEPGMSFNRRLPFSTRYVPIDKTKLMNNEFQLATQLPYLQSLAEKYGLYVGGAGLYGYIRGGKEGAKENIDFINRYTVDPVLDVFKGDIDKTTELLPEKKNGGWLSKYNSPEAENGIEGTMAGLTDVGFNYNGAWGGTMAMGGSLPGSVGFTYARTQDPAPSNGPYAKKTKASAQNGQEMKFYQEGLDWKPKNISNDGSVIEDDRGQLEYPGEITKINSNEITMQGVPYNVLGISNTGDTQMMQPGQDYTYEGKSVTEIPMMQDGGLMSYREPILKAKDRFVQRQMDKFGDAKFVNRALEIAEKQGYDFGADDGGPLDAVRHVAMSASVAKNLKVPEVIGKYAPALDDAIRMGTANLMGLGHEILNFNEGEGFFMDIKNNYIGSDIGVMKNLTDEERANKIAGMLKYNKLSIDNTKKPKKENGGWLSKYN